MTRTIGTSAYGLRCPIFREGDDLLKIIVDIVLKSGITIKDRDIIALTESIVARAQGNYVSVDEIAKDIKNKTNNPDTIIVINPIYSRNRFAMILKGIAKAANKEVIVVMPKIDEVGNLRDNHPVTKMNYSDYYSNIIRSEGKKPLIITKLIKNITISPNYAFIAADTHKSQKTKLNLKKLGYNNVISLSDICNDKCEYGLLGSNKASEEKLKLFPNTNQAQILVNNIQSDIKAKTGKNVDVMVYGDGCFKDDNTEIWEYADPSPCPAYTSGLEGIPNEIKIKNFADDKFKNLSGKDLNQAIKNEIKNKGDLTGKMSSQGTTPRKITSLLASAADLISGSGDKGTPVVYFQGYFDNFSHER